MPHFGSRSLRNLENVHPDLVTLCQSVIRYYDFAVICGYRTVGEQKRMFAEGKSKLDGVINRSKHQDEPSLAVDLLPWPADLHGVNIWQDSKRWAMFAGIVRGHAEQLGIRIRLGADWNMDGSMADHTFIDCPHVELVNQPRNL